MSALSKIASLQQLQVINSESNHRSILFIEDNPMDIDLTVQALLDNGVVNPIVICRDGEEALQFAKRCVSSEVSELPTLILLDLRLPRVSGLEVLAWFKKDPVWKTIPITILTTSAEDQDLQAAYSLGVNSYIVKPVDSAAFDEVANRIQLYWIVTNRVPPVHTS